MSYKSNHETNSATSSNLCLVPKAENTEQVATHQIYLCWCESNSQHALMSARGPSALDSRYSKRILPIGYNVVATQPRPLFLNACALGELVASHSKR